MNETKKHIDAQLIAQFNNNELDDNMYIRVLEHISSCEECCDIYSESFSQKNMLHLPHYLKSSIMERISQEEKSTHVLGTLKKSFNYQWFTYSLKVGFAMCAALFILFSGVLYTDTELQASEIPMIKMETIDKLNNKLYEFSNKLMMEESYYDKEKK